MEKHAAAFRDTWSERRDVPNEGRAGCSPLCPALSICMAGWLPKVGMCGMWLLCSSPHPPRPIRGPAWVGRHLYATFVFDFPLQAQCDALFPATAQCTQPSSSYCTHRRAHRDPLALARAYPLQHPRSPSVPRPFKSEQIARSVRNYSKRVALGDDIVIGVRATAEKVVRVLQDGNQ